MAENRISVQSQSEFGHRYVQAVPGPHPQLLLFRQCVVAMGLQCLSAHLVIVHERLQLVCATGRPDGLGDAALRAKSLEVRDVRPRGPAADLAVEVQVHVHGGSAGNARADAVPRLVLCHFDVVDGYVFLVGHGQLVQFLEVLAESAGRAHLQVVGVGEPPGADDGSVLGEVDVPVDVAMAVGDAGDLVTLGLCAAVFCGGAGVVLEVVHHQLYPLVPPGLGKETGETVWVNLERLTFCKLALTNLEISLQKPLQHRIKAFIP